MIPERDIRAVITGAAGGLGRAFALRLAKDGGRVVVADVDAEGGQATVRDVERAGGRAVFSSCDVRDPDQVQALLGVAEQELGGCDLVINNAGVAAAGNVGDVPLEDWRWQIEINLFGVIHGCHTFVPYFRKQGSGHVLNVASLAGLIAAPGMAPYNATKFAVVALSESMKGELDGSGVGVTVLCPSFFETNILRSSRRSGGIETGMAEKAMQRSRVQADDVARVALDAARKDALYALPHVEGRVFWGLKRLAPSAFSGLLSRLSKRRG